MGTFYNFWHIAEAVSILLMHYSVIGVFLLLNSITVRVNPHTSSAVGVASGTPSSTKVLNIFISGLAISRLLWLLEESAMRIFFHLGFASTFRATYNFGEQKINKIFQFFIDGPIGKLPQALKTQALLIS